MRNKKDVNDEQWWLIMDDNPKDFARFFFWGEEISAQNLKS